MADVKISQLPAASTPLAGTEEIPLVQSSTTKKITVSNLLTSANLGTPTAVNLTNATNVPVDEAIGVLPVANGGTGTSSPALVAGTNVTISGSWPNQTINSTGGGSGMVYPGAGIPNSTGSAWDTSYSTTGTGNVVLSTSPTLVTPALGTPTSGNFSTGTFTWPTFNQNTTGTAANITATTNTSLTTLSSLSLPGSQVSGNISGNATNVTGTVAIANGGTGQTSANAAFNALIPSQTGNSGKFLTTDGTDTSWATNNSGTVTSVGGTGTVNGLTLTGTVTTSGNLTLGGTLDLSSPPVIGNTTAAAITGTVVTGSTKVATPYVDAVSSAGGALRNASGTSVIQWGVGGSTNSSVDGSINLNGTNAQVDISPTGTGHVHINPAGSGSVEINPAAAGTINNMAIGGTTPAAGAFTTVTASTAIAVASGGTGATSLTANNVILGNGTSAVQVVAPSTSGNVLTSNGTTWVSQAPAASGVSQAKATAIAMVFGF